MRIGGLEFRPGRWPSLVTLLLLGLLLSLGFWQLDRAREKRALLAEFAQGRDGAIIQIEADLRSFDGLQYERAGAIGHYDTAHQFLLDNRTYNGKAGYHVLTPFMLRDSGAGVLVNRGWVPIRGGRDRLPELAVGSEHRRLTGLIKQPSGKTFMLGEEEARKGWPYRIQRIETERLARELGYPLLPIVLLLDPDEEDGFVRDWHPLVFGPERNVGYAVQWFGLALALLVIYIVVNTKKTDGYDDKKH
ncbi:MAG TPA: SURF1 family protein [Gammaproteobacteria bacterium]|nr:SURF1 family protein [Gammaproteobacteria bacterium]